MPTSPSPTPFGRVVADHLAAVEAENHDALATAARTVLHCLRSDGIVHTGGAGHSLAAVAETFYRAGGLACVRPLYDPELLPLSGARSSTAAERRTGLAADVLAASGFAAPDVLVVFSNSGSNPYPVELATTAVASGRPVIAVTSRAAAAAALRRAGSALGEVATVVLDTLVPAGDTTYPPDAPVTAALSTITNAFVWNLLLTLVLDGARREGVEPPLWRSANVPGGDDANSSLLDRYTARVPALR